MRVPKKKKNNMIKGLKMRRFLVVRTMGLLTIGLFSSLALATPVVKSYSLEKDGLVKFLAVGRPSALKIKGEGAAPTGELKETDGKLSGKFEFDLNTLKTGISMRDSHMKEKYLHVADHPQSRLTIEDLALPAEVVSGAVTSKEGVPFKGKLLLHGVEKEVGGTYDVKKAGSGYDVLAKLQLKLSDFKIDIPSYAGITVAENIDLEIKTAAKAVQ
jgi:hypothetical protein